MSDEGQRAPRRTRLADEAQRDRLLEGLRNYATAFNELGRQLGGSAGLHVTDAKALVEILEAYDSGTPLTQAGLSQRVGLTTGATSSLLNRLEAAGHIQRVRESADRRVVTLHPTPGVDAMVLQFFAPLTQRIDIMLDGYSPEVLGEFERFLAEMAQVMKSHSVQDVHPAE